MTRKQTQRTAPSLLEVDLAISKVSLSAMEAKSGTPVDQHTFAPATLLLNALRRDLQTLQDPFPTVSSSEVPDSVLRDMIQEAMNSNPPRLLFPGLTFSQITRTVELLESLINDRSISPPNAEALQICLIGLSTRIFENEKQGIEMRHDKREKSAKRTLEAAPAQDLCRADLSGADLSGVHLNRADLRGANLSNASLSGADLSKADLSGAHLNRADLSGANLIEAGLDGAKLYRANLYRADLSGANLRSADLCCANLNGADLSWANLNNANLSGADLRGANLNRARLRWAHLYQADLSGAHLNRADLGWTNLGNANLSGVDLSDADLSNADLRGANLSGADLSSANLWNTDFTGAQLKDTVLEPNAKIPRIEDQTILDAGLAIDGDWIYGFRTSASAKCQYHAGTVHTAPWFSVCTKTQCHPGIYLAGLPWFNRIHSWPPLVRVRCKRKDLHHVGDKWRARQIEVLEDCEMSTREMLHALGQVHDK